MPSRTANRQTARMLPSFFVPDFSMPAVGGHSSPKRPGGALFFTISKADSSPQGESPVLHRERRRAKKRAPSNTSMPAVGGHSSPKRPPGRFSSPSAKLILHHRAKALFFTASVGELKKSSFQYLHARRWRAFFTTRNRVLHPLRRKAKFLHHVRPDVLHRERQASSNNHSPPCLAVLIDFINIKRIRLQAFSKRCASSAVMVAVFFNSSSQ